MVPGLGPLDSPLLIIRSSQTILACKHWQASLEEHIRRQNTDRNDINLRENSLYAPFQIYSFSFVSGGLSGQSFNELDTKL